MGMNHPEFHLLCLGVMQIVFSPKLSLQVHMHQNTCGE
uniref:Uncharacterized protein n=1 Tax=Arundo donax TaxID=35708 RepID=A0A0A9BYW8_ARUDO